MNYNMTKIYFLSIKKRLIFKFNNLFIKNKNQMFKIKRIVRIRLEERSKLND
jgi:hypothetical protein